MIAEKRKLFFSFLFLVQTLSVLLRTVSLQGAASLSHLCYSTSCMLTLMLENLSLVSIPAKQHAARKCVVKCTLVFGSALCIFVAIAVLLVMNCTALELNGELTLHVHLAGKSVMHVK